MTLTQIIDIADTGYGDGLVKLYHEQPAYNHGDGLADFIARELRDTFPDDAADVEQLIEAIWAIESAADDMKKVLAALHAEFNKRIQIPAVHA